jgi:ABC-type lipoprotein export system ATPase subunit
MNATMHTPKTPLVAAALLAVLTLVPTVRAAEGAELTAEERQRLTAARRVASDKPEVLAAEEQAKADRAQVRKLYLDYKALREKSAASEEAHKRLLADAMAKADPAAPALMEKERAAFRARMEKSRKAGKEPDTDDAPPE